MKKEIHQSLTFQRFNVLLEIIFGFFMSICSFPRMPIESIMRKRMGVQYFGVMSTITLATILFFLPYVVVYRTLLPMGEVIKQEWLWYLFMAVFLYFSYLRWLEVKHKPGFFDFSRYGLSSGYTHPRYRNFWMSILGKNPNPRTMYIYLEPLPFLLAGLLLCYMGMMLGYLLIFCAVCYSGSYMAGFYWGDQQVYRVINARIIAEEAEDIIMDDKSPEDSRGVQFLFSRPATNQDRERMRDALLDDDTNDASPVY